jgi:acyl carrier protein
VTAGEAREAVRGLLGRIAPEADLGALDDRSDLREALDLDSMDFLAFVTALHEELGVEVPEADYRRIATLEGVAAYVAERRGA